MIAVYIWLPVHVQRQITRLFLGRCKCLEQFLMQDSTSCRAIMGVIAVCQYLLSYLDSQFCSTITLAVVCRSFAFHYHPGISQYCVILQRIERCYSIRWNLQHIWGTNSRWYRMLFWHFLSSLEPLTPTLLTDLHISRAFFYAWQISLLLVLEC